MEIEQRIRLICSTPCYRLYHIDWFQDSRFSHYIEARLLQEPLVYKSKQQDPLMPNFLRYSKVWKPFPISKRTSSTFCTF